MTKAVRWSQEHLDAHRQRLTPKPKESAVAPPQIKPKPTRSKYASQKVEDAAGVRHDSKKEARRWTALQMLEKAGKITELRRQVPFELAPKVKLAGEARMKPAIRYLADFCYLENGELVVEDCKSAPTRKLPAYRIKKHLLKTVLGLDIKEV